MKYEHFKINTFIGFINDYKSKSLQEKQSIIFIKENLSKYSSLEVFKHDLKNHLLEKGAVQTVHVDIVHSATYVGGTVSGHELNVRHYRKGSPTISVRTPVYEADIAKKFEDGEMENPYLKKPDYVGN